MNTALVGIILVGLLVGVVMTAMASYVQIEPAHKGVITTWGKIEDRTLGEGLQQITPFVQQIVQIRIADNLLTADAPSGTHDLLDVNTQIALQYNVKPDMVNELYRKYLGEHEAIFIAPAIQEVTKSVTANFNAPQLITERAQVKQELEKSLKERIESSGFFTVSTISITDFVLPESYRQNVLAKENAIQEAQGARNTIETEKAKAEQNIAKAQGEAEAIRLQAEAVRNNPEYMRLLALQKWNGILPLVTGDGGIPLIDLGNLIQENHP
jgi:regulator of protease activity HflC (stomatin/prohibitin superfamily)